MSPRLAALVVVVLGCAATSEKPPGSDGKSAADPVTARGVHFTFDGDPTEWRTAQSTFTDAAGLHTGSIWVDQNDSGLVIAGVAFGDPPKWPGRESDLSRSDRVILTLADAQPPVFPPVGWGHQFGYQELASSADCVRKAAEDNSGPKDRGRCVAWFDQQIAYRDTVSRLFERQWQVAPGFVRENFASRAFDSLEGQARDRLAALKPAAVPVVKFTTKTPGVAYGFEAVVPWEAFPPVASLTLSDLRLGVRFASPSGPPVTRTLSPYSLPKPRQYQLTPCSYGIGDSIVISTGPNRDWLDASDHARAYYVPTMNLDVRRSLVLDNEAQGYMYEPGADTRSPVVRLADYWTRDLGEGSVLCGPRLAVEKDGRVTRSEWVVDQGLRLEIRSLPNGDRLIKDGPRAWMSYYGSGQCGACPRTGVTIYYEKSSGAITRAFDHLGVVETESRDVDYAISPDWQSVDVFEGALDTSRDTLGVFLWSQTTYCFRSGKRDYQECGKKAGVQPPTPRNINPDSLFH